jgi:hypothetical protein
VMLALGLLTSFLGFLSPKLAPFVIYLFPFTSIFRSWMVLFNSFTCLDVFSYTSLRELFMSFS